MSTRERVAPPPASKAGVLLLGAAFGTTLGLGACSPYPDDGEFLAGVVYSANFIAGVKTMAQLPAVGRSLGPTPDGIYPYTVVATTSASSGATAVSSSAPATSPFWTNNGKRQPLDRASAQTVYVFDGSCASPNDYMFDSRLDLIRLDRQYPIFQDIPEVLSANAGKAGRTAAYSAVVEVVHLRAPGDLPCQSIKRFDTTQSRIGDGGDLVEGAHEYRLYQIFDPAIAAPPLPFQLGFYNQLVVPYIDMGPVPLEPDGKTFRTMPIYKGMPAGAYSLVYGSPSEAGPLYSPICRDYTLTLAMGTTLPWDASDAALQKAVKTENLSSCVVCRTLDEMGNMDCPYANSQVAQ